MDFELQGLGYKSLNEIQRCLSPGDPMYEDTITPAQSTGVIVSVNMNLPVIHVFV